MNIKYYITLGLILDIALGSNGWVTLGSILPDLGLLKNEIKLFFTKKSFDPNSVTHLDRTMYFTTHSFFILPFLNMIHGYLALGYFLHLISDMFTHTGVFSARPFYPFNYVFKYGREVLK